MYFVTGTDTGVGKTVIAAALTLGLKGTYWKPIQTGLESDTEWVKKSTGSSFLPEVYRFALPESPHFAARQEGVAISLSKIELPPVRPLIVEGAGGVMVPLNDKELMIDLMQHLGLPLIVVSRSTLGTINHTLLTLERLRQARLPIAGVVLNGPKNPHNRAAIEQYGRVKVLGEVEPIERLDQVALQGIFCQIGGLC
jgi:dethiobiotin synthetase